MSSTADTHSCGDHGSAHSRIRRRRRIRQRPSLWAAAAAAAATVLTAAAIVGQASAGTAACGGSSRHSSSGRGRPSASASAGGQPFPPSFFASRGGRTPLLCFGPPPSSTTSSSAVPPTAPVAAAAAAAQAAAAAAAAGAAAASRRPYMTAAPGPLFASTNGQAGGTAEAAGGNEQPPPPPAALKQQRERVHITRFDGQTPQEQQEAAAAAAAAGSGGAGPKPVTCLWYDLEGAGVASAAAGGSGTGGEVAFLEHPGAFYFLGGSRESFLQYVRQELGQPGAVDGSVAEARVPDLGAEKDRFAALWRGGRLLVEDPNALDVINNKTSFGELLMTYTHRMRKTDEDPLTSEELLGFFQREYGAGPTAQALFDPERPPDAAMAALKDLLLWFKEGFPYYKSTCLHCGHKDQPGNRMLGVVAPNPSERQHNATLTEVYACGNCGKVFRFPRAVALARVIETRRGRCGEYSRLFFKAAEALRYRARWVVDWEDHVWVEVDLPGKGWVHLDPCEAAVDEPLLYQGWGKNQTYILAFTREAVEDVTHTYTSDASAALARRTVNPQEFASLLEEATGLLRQPNPPLSPAAAAAGGAAATTATKSGGRGGGRGSKGGGGNSGGGGKGVAESKEANQAGPSSVPSGEGVGARQRRGRRAAAGGGNRGKEGEAGDAQ